MNEQWFWQTQGESYGPLGTSELESLVRRGRIRDDDLIQLEGTADWIRAAELKAVFLEETGAGRSETNAADAAARALQRRALFHGEASDDDAFDLGVLRNVKAGATNLSGLAMGVAGLIDGLLSQLWSLVGRKSTLILVAVVFVAVLLRNIEWTDTLAQDTRERLAETWSEVESMKHRNLPPEEWAAFESETLDWLSPAIKALETAALQNQSGVNRWMPSRVHKSLGQQQLVSAACILRDVLADERKGKAKEESPEKRRKRRFARPMLLPAHDDSTPEALFAQRMSVADAFLAGKIPTAGAIGGTSTAGEDVSPIMVGFVVLDVVLIVGGLAWWVNRRRHAA